jgi:adenylate cyclase class 2
MTQEHEVKVLNIDVADITRKLKKIGAKKKGDFFYRSCSFDYEGFPLDKKMSWIRLRDEGDKVRLAYKRRLGVKSSKGDDAGMEEIEFDVGHYDKARHFLHKIGLILKFGQEKKRTRWVKGNIEFDIDTCPRLAPYLEIEGKTEAAMKRGIKLLGIDPQNCRRFSTTQLYEMQGIRDKDYISMTFDEFVKRDGKRK